jgi:hypothetical protein
MSQVPKSQHDGPTIVGRKPVASIDMSEQLRCVHRMSNIGLTCHSQRAQDQRMLARQGEGKDETKRYGEIQRE